MKIRTSTQTLLVGIPIILLGYLACHLIQSKSYIDTPSVKTEILTASLSCGPAALMAIAWAHDKKTVLKLSSLLADDNLATSGITSLYDLANWARAAGMKPMGLKIDSANLAQLPLPAIVHFKTYHFLTLVAVNDEQATVVDRGTLGNEIRRKDFDDRFSGYVLYFQ